MQITSLDGSGMMPAYANGPASAKAAIIVVQEIFGVNPGIRALVDHWAGLGYRAVAPELYWQFASNVSLDPEAPEHFETAIGYRQKLDMDTAIRDIEATIKTLRASGIRKVGLVGYCLGGFIAYLSVCRTDVDASVGYYGVRVPQVLNEAKAIANPLIMHIATQDSFVPPADQAAMHSALDGHELVTLYDYDADHGFARHDGASRSPDMADLADGRTAAFFKQHLG